MPVLRFKALPEVVHCWKLFSWQSAATTVVHLGSAACKIRARRQLHCSEKAYRFSLASMQTALRIPSCIATPAGLTRRPPSRASASGRVFSKNANTLPLQSCRPCAVKDEEAELDRITQQASQADIWDNEFVGTAFKVALVAGLVAVAVFIGRLGEPIVENTIKSFPTPADYEAYESR